MGTRRSWAAGRAVFPARWPLCSWRPRMDGPSGTKGPGGPPRRTCAEHAACEMNFQPPPVHQPLTDPAVLCVWARGGTRTAAGAQSARGRGLGRVGGLNRFSL